MKILVTGCAGFIGSNLCDKLLGLGHEVCGIDNFNDYYDPKIKERNIGEASSHEKFKLYREDILNSKSIHTIFVNEKPEKVVHLAARAGVRPSIVDPELYAKVNVEGTVNILDSAAFAGVGQLIFASSSSVYGESNNVPFTEDDLCGNIISPYGSSKRAAEFFVESFHHNFGLKSTIIRFFTVYGRRGRLDMAPALFTKAILSGKPVFQFGNGDSMRDYTYVDDICEGIVASLEHVFDLETINLGNDSPVKLTDFISTIEVLAGKKARITKEEAKSGDVSKTWASVKKAKELLGWEPKTKIEEGMGEYIRWYKDQL